MGKNQHQIRAPQDSRLLSTRTGRGLDAFYFHKNPYENSLKSGDHRSISPAGLHVIRIQLYGRRWHTGISQRFIRRTLCHMQVLRLLEALLKRITADSTGNPSKAIIPHHMKIIETKHFKERVAERRSYKEEAAVRSQFMEAVGLLKKKKLHSRKGKLSDSHILYHLGNKFVYIKQR